MYEKGQQTISGNFSLLRLWRSSSRWKLKYGDRKAWRRARRSWWYRRSRTTEGNGAVLNKMMSTKFPSSAVLDGACYVL